MTKLKGIALLLLSLTATTTVSADNYSFRSKIIGVELDDYRYMTPEEREQAKEIEKEKSLCLLEYQWEESETKTRMVGETRYRTKTQSETYTKTWPTLYDGQISGNYQSGNSYWSKDGRGGSTNIVYGNEFYCQITSGISNKRSSYWKCGDVEFFRGTLIESDYPFHHYSVYIKTQETRDTEIQVPYTVQVEEEYQVIETKKTDNYDSCQSKGYDTKN